MDQGVAGVVLRSKFLTGEARGGLVEGAVVGQFDPSGCDGFAYDLFDMLGGSDKFAAHDKQRRAGVVLLEEREDLLDLGSWTDGHVVDGQGGDFLFSPGAPDDARLVEFGYVCH